MDKRRGKQVSLAGILQHSSMQKSGNQDRQNSAACSTRGVSKIKHHHMSCSEHSSVSCTLQSSFPFLFYLFFFFGSPASLPEHGQTVPGVASKCPVTCSQYQCGFPGLQHPDSYPKNMTCCYVMPHLLAEVMGIILQLDPGWKQAPFGYSPPKCTRNSRSLGKKASQEKSSSHGEPERSALRRCVVLFRSHLEFLK